MTSKAEKTPPNPEDKGVYLFMDEVTQESCRDLISFMLTKSCLLYTSDAADE